MLFSKTASMGCAVLGMLALSCGLPSNPLDADQDLDGVSIRQGDCDDNRAEATYFCGQAIQVGEYEMGCPSDQELCNEDEVPVHTVKLSHDFIISETEVTQAQFKAHMGWNPSVFSDCGPDCPVDFVHWYQAAAYANALSDFEGLDNCFSCDDSNCTAVEDPFACEGYRLPTEAEWEFAARCGEDTLYAGSENADEVAWHTGNSHFSTQPVASLKPNACGLYDMSGNVWEWAWDPYQKDYYANSPILDPIGPVEGDGHAMRGGSATNESDDARVTERCSGCHPIHIVNSVGFRLVKTSL